MISVGDEVIISYPFDCGEIYNIIGGNQNRLLVQSGFRSPIFSVFYDGEWRTQIPYQRVEFLNPDFKLWKPEYPLGTILVISVFSGSQTSHKFLKLKHRRPSGNYIADELGVDAKNIYSGSDRSEDWLIPNDKIVGEINLKWYPSRSLFSDQRLDKRAYVTNSVYDPSKIYRSDWISYQPTNKKISKRISKE